MTDAPQPPAPPPDWHLTLQERLNRREQARLQEQEAKETHGRLLKAWQDYCYASIGHWQEHTWHSFQRHWLQAQALEQAYQGADQVVFGGLGEWRVQWDQLWAAPEEPEWLCEPIIGRGRAHALFAGAKTGKSFLMLPLAAALATGRPFLRHPGGHPVTVVYIDYEMSREDLIDWLSQFGYGPQDNLDNLHWILMPSIPGLDKPEGAQYVCDYAKHVGARLVIIDTAARAVEGPENDSDTFRDFYRWTGINLKAEGIAWVRIDHAGKDVTKGQRGASAKNDDVDVVWQMVRKDQGTELTATHRRPGFYPPKIDLTLQETDGRREWKIAEQLWPAGTSELANTLEQLGVPVDASQRKAREALRAANEKATEAVLRAALRWRNQSDLCQFTATKTVRRGQNNTRDNQQTAQPTHATNPQVSEPSRNSSRPVAASGLNRSADVPLGTSRATGALQAWIGNLNDQDF